MGRTGTKGKLWLVVIFLVCTTSVIGANISYSSNVSEIDYDGKLYINYAGRTFEYVSNTSLADALAGWKEVYMVKDKSYVSFTTGGKLYWAVLNNSNHVSIISSHKNSEWDKLIGFAEEQSRNLYNVIMLMIGAVLVYALMKEGDHT